MDFRSRRELRAFGDSARRKVAEAAVLAATEENQKNYKNGISALARANRFGTLESLIVRRVKTHSTRQAAIQHFMIKMGRWMVEQDAQAYLKVVLAKFIAHSDTPDASFDWETVVEGDETKATQKKRALDFLNLPDSPILDYMCALKLSFQSELSGGVVSDALPLDYLEDMDVNVAHHHFLIEFFCDMLPGYFMDNSKREMPFSDYENDLDDLYASYNAFTHSAAAAILSTYTLHQGLLLEKNEPIRKQIRADIIAVITSADFEKKNPVLNRILTSLTPLLAMQLLCALFLNLNQQVALSPNERKAFVTWINTKTGDLYVMRFADDIIRNANFAEHESAIYYLGFLLGK